jgi:shikimate kinase
MLIPLVGPKGSGKSHIGRTLERQLGVHFFHVEPLWMSYYAECRAAGREPSIAEGIARVHPRIVDALGTHEHVCVETTGAAAEILGDLLSLAQPSKTLVARVAAPLELCLERIAARDESNQIPMDIETIRKVYALSGAATVPTGLTLRNEGLGEAEIVSMFRNALNCAH